MISKLFPSRSARLRFSQPSIACQWCHDQDTLQGGRNRDSSTEGSKISDPNTEKLVGFERFKELARRLMGDPKKLNEMLVRTAEKAQSHQSGTEGFWEEFLALIRLLKAWAAGAYRNTKPSTIVLAIAAALYFLNPFDAVVDYIPGVGLIDDFTVITIVLRAIRFEITEFLSWERDQRSNRVLDSPRN